MSTNPFLEQKLAAVDRLNSRILRFANTDRKILLKLELGLLGFQEAEPLFNTIIDSVIRLQEANLQSLPNEILEQTAIRLEELASCLDRIARFNPIQENQTAAHRNELVANLERHYAGFYEAAHKIFASVKPKMPSLEDMQAEARKGAAKLDELLKETTALQQRIEIEANAALAMAKQAAAESGVTVHAGLFQAEATTHRKLARAWLAGTILCAVVTALAAGGSIYLLLTSSLKLDTAYAIQLTASKLVLFSVLYFATLWAAKIHKAHKHNELVNQHRHNALRTFEAFAAASKDADTKNAVLIQTTQSIFGQTGTGFTAGESDNAAPPQILEIVRSATSRQSGT